MYLLEKSVRKTQKVKRLHDLLVVATRVPVRCEVFAQYAAQPQVFVSYKILGKLFFVDGN